MKLLREPLVHFALAGAVLFAIDAAFGGEDDPATDPELRVEVTLDDLAQLRADWDQKWGRPPTAGESAGMVEEFVREELLYREACRLELEVDDTIVRRRLAQKMEFLSKDRGLIPEPTEAQLAIYLEANSETYTEPPRITFTHVFFGTDARGAGAEADARAVLLKLQAMPDPPERAPQQGDRFVMQFDYALETQDELRLLFGPEFAADLWTAPAGEWSGPFASPFGRHLVRVAERVDASLASIGEIRDRVRTDWIEAQRDRNYQRFYDSLRKRYTVTFAAGVPQPAGE